MLALLLPLVLKLGVPERIAKPVAKVALIIAAAALLIGGFMLWLRFHDRGVVATDRSAAKAAALSTAREADEQAETAANRKSEEVEDGNDRAREAAAGSDDPLGDALRSLRPAAD